MNPKTLKALLKVAAKNDIRYYFNGVHITCVDDVVTLEATDGHVAMRLTLKDASVSAATGTDVILCRDSLTRALKAYGVKDKPALEVCRDSATLGGAPIELVDGRFPDTRRAMGVGRGYAPAPELGLDAALLSRLCGACADVLHKEKFKGVKFEVRDALSPFCLSRVYSDVNTLEAAIMPVRL